MHSEQVSIIYVFNLVVGAGALALPQAFALTGWVLGIVAIIVLGTVSFVTSTFMVEAMAIANAVLLKEKQLQEVGASEVITDASVKSQANEETSLLQLGLRLFFVVIGVYLYGDLAIYATAVPKSLTLVVCLDLKNLTSSAFHGEDICFRGLTVATMYRLFLLCFTLVMGPFVFFDLGKTKYLQFVTTFFRWLAFLLMISLAFYHIGHEKKKIAPKLFDFSQLPNFFGVSVYSFMCQHSLPSILTPTKRKKRLTGIMSASFLMVTLFYLLLTVTAVFCFPEEKIVDIYTLNFLNAKPVFAYFLALFPVFTLSTNFPIIAITLRENLKTIFACDSCSCSPLTRRFVFPLLTVVPPIGVAFVTHNVELLVGITGAYAGALIQYVVPVMLVFCGRRVARRHFGVYTNKHRSVFRQRSWIFIVLAWTVACIALVTSNYLIQAFKKK
eukprot:gene8874-9824_t